MQFEKVQLNAPHLTLWLSNDKGLVFHQGQKELSQIEPISIALLIALDEGLTNEQAIIELQQHSNLSKEQLKPSLEQVKVLFKNTEEQRTYADGLYPELQNHITQQPQQQSFCIKVANATFAITSDDEELLQSIKSLLTPIKITAPNEVDFAIHIEIYKDNYLLVSNDIVVEEGLAQNQVMPVFIDRLQILAYQHSDYCFGFHGAALTSPSPLVPSTSSLALSSPVTILLPGVSGAGKSTLTAELSKQNFSVYSDEIIALNNDFQLTTLALPMAIKSGSWQHIAKLYPEINNQAEWHRVDGRILKYIWPEQIASQKDPGLEGKTPLPEFVSGSQETTNDEQSKEIDPDLGSGILLRSTSSIHGVVRQEDFEGSRGNDGGGVLSHSSLVLDTLDEVPNSSHLDLNTETTPGAPTEQLSPSYLSLSPSTLLISPSFNKNTTPKATKLSVIDTIALVTNGGYQLGVELNEARVEQLIHYCEQISAYQIIYANSEQAQQLVEQLCKQ